MVTDDDLRKYMRPGCGPITATTRNVYLHKYNKIKRKKKTRITCALPIATLEFCGGTTLLC